MADRGPSVPPRFEVLRHGPDAADLSQWTEFNAVFSEHVAPGERGEEIRAAVRPNARKDALCGPSPGARHQRVCLFRLRRRGGGGDGRTRGVGSYVDLAWPRRPP